MERDEQGTVSVAAILRTEELASEFFDEEEYRLLVDKVNASPEYSGSATTPEEIAACLGREAVGDAKDRLDAYHWLDGATTALRYIADLREG